MFDFKSIPPTPSPTKSFISPTYTSWSSRFCNLSTWKSQRYFKICLSKMELSFSTSSLPNWPHSLLVNHVFIQLFEFPSLGSLFVSPPSLIHTYQLRSYFKSVYFLSLLPPLWDQPIFIIFSLEYCASFITGLPMSPSIPFSI